MNWDINCVISSQNSLAVEAILCLWKTVLCDIVLNTKGFCAYVLMMNLWTL